VNVVSPEPSSSQSFEPLLLGHVRPTGWLRRQLEIRRAVLAISTVLARHRRQLWIGGQAEGWAWPYWLGGVAAGLLAG